MKTKVFFVIVFFITASAMAVHSQVTIGSDAEPSSGALLDLKEFANQDTTSANKGLIFPRVKLTNVTELYPMYGKNAASEMLEYRNNRARLKAKHTGMVVYNLTSDTIFSRGLYVWNGSIWIKPVTEIPALPSSPNINMLDLLTNVSPVADGDSTDSGSTGGGGSTLNFGPITISENGSYIFSIRLYGEHKVGTGVYYLSLWANGTELKDIAELDINVAAFRTGIPACTYSITIGGHFKANDKVSFKLAAHPTLSAGNNWSLVGNPGQPKKADRTSMIWWRL